MKRRLTKGQIIGVCAVILLLLGVAALLCYDLFVLKTVDKEHIMSAALIAASLVVTLIRLLSPEVKGNTRKANRRRAYREAYGEHIRSAFADQKKAESLLYDALEDYNAGRFAKALDKLDKLSKEARTADERFIVAFCKGLTLDSMRLYEQAIAQYEKALAARESGTVYSNMGICYSELGKQKEAIEAYLLATELEPKNPAPYSNLASLYIREVDYEKALDYAQKANACDPKYAPALSAQAICYAMMDNEEKYQEYYRRAAAVGYNVERMKRFIESLKNG